MGCCFTCRKGCWNCHRPGKGLAQKSHHRQTLHHREYLGLTASKTSHFFPLHDRTRLSVGISHLAQRDSQLWENHKRRTDRSSSLLKVRADTGADNNSSRGAGRRRGATKPVFGPGRVNPAPLLYDWSQPGAGNGTRHPLQLLTRWSGFDWD